MESRLRVEVESKLLDYLESREDAKLIGGNMSGRNARELAREFRLSRQLNSDADNNNYDDPPPQTSGTSGGSGLKFATPSDTLAISTPTCNVKKDGEKNHLFHHPYKFTLILD
ncbi:hypothetical protein H6G97_47600 [Nostoc flagelliforme FACHB-838]|uniref:Uncharacterized protein n=1 Tax=Nostoc flagelliforme FACHB-838 TaxID=2692904 RepID=A0ABR8E7P2_9NOSO|nr:hypothetical protein [Nostoc flagelliforme]MBD2536535.1 hypothetical protein [Nostoc flagelliforme FACHB-838]